MASSTAEPRRHAELTAPRDGDVLVTANRGDVVVEVDELDLAYPSVQPLPGNRFLVVGARCRRGPAALRRNALVFDRSGGVVGSAMVGDGIEAVATTPDLRCSWQYPGHPEHGEIIDCYALTTRTG